MEIEVAVSACLLGQEVRFNGSHKRSNYIDAVLREHFKLKPLCPEMGIGMGVPRKPIHLITRMIHPDEPNGTIDAVYSHDHSVEFTKPLKDYAGAQATQLQNCSGYIFMQKSPSCGFHRVKVYHDNGNPLEAAQGIYAAEIDRLLPLMPKEDAGRLNDPWIRENFITRVFAYHDWQSNVATEPTAKKILDFHVRYKYMVMAHHIPTYKSLGQLVSNLKAQPIQDIADAYIKGFMDGLKHIATRKKHSNVLQHLQGYLKKDLSAQDKEELWQLIQQYQKGNVPLSVPFTLLFHHIKTHTQDDHYLRLQKYLNPHPYELGLRNAI